MGYKLFSGGLVQRLPILRTLICDTFGVGYRMSPTAEDTLLGLLALAFTGRAASVAWAVTDLRQVYGVAANRV